MDPNEALRMIRLASHELAKVSDDETLDLLIDTFRGLDEWLSKGGFLPSAWQAKTDPPRLADPLGPPNPAHGELPEGWVPKDLDELIASDTQGLLSNDPYCAKHGARFDPEVGCPACLAEL